MPSHGVLQAAGLRAPPLLPALPHGRLRCGVPRGGAQELRVRPHAARGALQRAPAVRAPDPAATEAVSTAHELRVWPHPARGPCMLITA